MQNTSLQGFKDDIFNIKEYIRHIELVNGVETVSRDLSNEILKEFREHIHAFSKHKKIFEYKAIIISLYGVLEYYIGSWIQEFIDTLPSLVDNYNNLPEKLRKNHFDLSIKLIKMVSENRYAKYEHLQKEDILINLSSCLELPSSYKLNCEAFSPFSGNLKHQKIVDALKALDIELVERLKTNTKFRSFLIEKYGPNIDNRGIELFSKIDDLVVRRNDISHGMQVDDLLKLTEFDDYIEFLENYGVAIFETLLEEILRYESKYLYEKIDRVIAVYKQGSVLCFELENNNIKIGDYIIVEMNSFFEKKDVLQIEVDNQSMGSISSTKKTNIGVNLGGGISKQQNFYIKKAIHNNK